MSWLSNLTGIHLGNIGAPVGAAIGSFIPGVGTAIGAGLGQAIGGIGAGHGVAKSALEGAGVYGGAKLAGLGSSGGGGDPTTLGTFSNGSSDPSSMIGTTAGNGDPGVSMGGAGASGGGFLQGVESFLKGHLGGSGGQPGSGGSGGSGSGSGGILGSLEGLLTGNGGMNVLGAAQGVNAAMQQKKANDYANSAMSTVQKSYDSRAPLRTAGIAGLLNPQTPSIAGLSQIAQTGNPYATGKPNGVMSVNQQMQPQIGAAR